MRAWPTARTWRTIGGFCVWVSWFARGNQTVVVGEHLEVLSALWQLVGSKLLSQLWHGFEALSLSIHCGMGLRPYSSSVNANAVTQVMLRLSSTHGDFFGRSMPVCSARGDCQRIPILAHWKFVDTLLPASGRGPERERVSRPVSSGLRGYLARMPP